MTRNQLIQLIHVAKRELRLDEETYRTALRTATAGKAHSTGDMDVPALMKALEHMKRAGFKVRPKALPARSRPLTINRDASKVRALWLFLHHLGAVRDPSEEALATYVKRIAKVDDLRWARGDRTDLLIETLKKWAMRYLPKAVQALKAELQAIARARPLTEDEMRHAGAAHACLLAGQGFDLHWWAWEHLTEALGRPVQPEIKVLEARKP